MQDWNECLLTNIAIERIPNSKRINSLRKTALERINYFEKIKPQNIRFIFEAYYTSLIELLHALTMQDGYIIKNHLCLGFYLKDVLKNIKLFKIFNDARERRNKLVYYGKL